MKVQCEGWEGDGRDAQMLAGGAVFGNCGGWHLFHEGRQ